VSGSFSLVEKLAVAGAFCAMMVMAVGTEEDPGVVAAADPQLVAPAHSTQAPVASVTSNGGSEWWSGLGRRRDAAAEDERGSIGVEKAPEPPPRAF
jgi:hypothetical protein